MELEIDCPSDGQLLTEFCRLGRQIAFEQIVLRHGDMVRNVCRRILRNEQDAEDAAQAVFITLAQKGVRLTDRQSLAGWLHLTARNIANNLRTSVLRRSIHERRSPAPVPRDGLAGQDLRQSLDDALKALPDKYREPIVLHHLEQMDYDSASQQLGVNAKTFSTRLVRGREMLRQQLVRSGIGVSAIALAAFLSDEAVAATIPESVARAWTQEAILMKGATPVATSGWKIAIPVFVVLLSLIGGAFALSTYRWEEKDPAKENSAKQQEGPSQTLQSNPPPTDPTQERKQQGQSFQTQEARKGKFDNRGESLMIPPKIAYAGNRTSKSLIAIGGTQYAVDDGIEWQGIKVYVSLTFELLAVDTQTNKGIWHTNIGAFWKEMTFKELETSPGVKTWCVELRPKQAPANQGDQQFVQYHELKTGKKIELPADISALGLALAPPRTWSGKDGVEDKAFQDIATTQASWSALQKRLLGVDNDPRFASKIDFNKEVVLVVSNGKGYNSLGVNFSEGFTNEKRLLIRLHSNSYQSFGETPIVHPYGIFVLPRLEKRQYIVEYNRQNLIGGPPVWKKLYSIDQL